MFAATCAYAPYPELPSCLSARNCKADLRQDAAAEHVSCGPTGNACEIVGEEGEDYEPVAE